MRRASIHHIHHIHHIHRTSIRPKCVYMATIPAKLFADAVNRWLTKPFVNAVIGLDVDRLREELYRSHIPCIDFKYLDKNGHHTLSFDQKDPILVFNTALKYEMAKSPIPPTIMSISTLNHVLMIDQFTNPRYLIMEDFRQYWDKKNSDSLKCFRELRTCEIVPNFATLMDMLRPNDIHK